MRIVCPSCLAIYEVPDSILAAAPRTVRCARCSTEWDAEPVPDGRPGSFELPADAPAASGPTAALPPAPTTPESPDPPPAPLPPVRAERKLSGYRPRGSVVDEDERLPPQDYESPPSRRGALIGWGLTVVVLAVIGWSAVSYRGQVMAAWPPSERVYAALGLL